MKPSLQNPSNTQCSIQETDNSYLVRIERKQYIPIRRIGISISWRTLAFIIIALLALSMLHKIPFSDSPEHENTVAANVPSSPTEEYDSSCLWKDSGFLFPDSDIRCLDEDDILSLSRIEGYTEAELLRYAINEIYARHNYLFITEEYLHFFNSYDWYDGYLGADDASASFNSIEHKNIAILLKAEDKYK